MIKKDVSCLLSVIALVDFFCQTILDNTKKGRIMKDYLFHDWIKRV